MKLKSGYLEEYKRRHDEIWPELCDLLKKAGLSDYYIFLDEETHTLFGVQKRSQQFSENDLVQNPIMRRWWDYMADIMLVNEDNSPLSTPLSQMFYLP